MTDERKELIERWALEAFGDVFARNCIDPDKLERFAALVRADALEEAAKVCDDRQDVDYYDSARSHLVFCADAIRKLIPDVNRKTA